MKLIEVGTTGRWNSLPDANLGWELFKSVNQGLVKICRGMISSNGPSHDWSHVVEVAEAGVEIAKRLKLDPVPFLLAALCHDLFCDSNRAEHHNLAGAWVRENLGTFESKSLVEVVARMCEQHRASYKGEYSGIMEEAFAAADRGLVGINRDVRMYERAVKYALERGEVSIVRACGIAAKHIGEKFGKGGYAKWPELYVRLFGADLEAMQDRVAARPHASHVLEVLCNARLLTRKEIPTDDPGCYVPRKSAIVIPFKKELKDE